MTSGAERSGETGGLRGGFARLNLHPVWTGWILLAVVLVPYLNAIPNGFVWDDEIQIRTEVPEGFSWVRAFTGPSWLALDPNASSSERDISTWRPLPLLTLVLDAALWGEAKWGYHLTNVVLFLALIAMLYAAAVAITGRCLLSALVTAGFGLQPILTESVSWVSGRHDVIMALWLAVSATLLLRGAAWSSGRRAVAWTSAMVAYVLALLSKEPACLFPVIVGLVFFATPLGQRFERRHAWGLLGTLLGITVGYLVYRSQVIAEGNMVGSSHNILDAAALAPWASLKFLGYVFVRPNLTSHYFQPLDVDFAAWQFWLPLLGHVAIYGSAWVLRRRLPATLVGVHVFYLFLAPALVIVANKPEYSYRFLFVPSLGVVMALAEWIAFAFRRVERPALRTSIVAAIGLGFVFQGLAIHGRNQDYDDNGSFYASIVRDQPESPFGYFGLADWHLSQNNFGRAHALYLETLRREPSFIKAYNNLSVLLLRTGQLDAAGRVLAEGLARDPSNPKLHFNLGQVLHMRGEFDQAERHYRQALALRPGYRVAQRELDRLLRESEAGSSTSEAAAEVPP